jgi:hypothetical protein
MKTSLGLVMTGYCCHPHQYLNLRQSHYWALVLLAWVLHEGRERSKLTNNELLKSLASAGLFCGRVKRSRAVYLYIEGSKLARAYTAIF